MEQMRLVIAIVASILVFVLWEFFFAEKPPQSIQNEQKVVESVQKNNTLNKKESIPHNITVPEAKTIHNTKTIKVETPLYSAVLDEKGAILKSFALKRYKETLEKDSPFKELIVQNKNIENIKSFFGEDDIYGIGNAVFTSDSDTDSIHVDSTKSISFYFKSDNGLIVHKKYIFSADTYLIDVIVTVQNKSDKAINGDFILSLFGNAPEKKASYGFEGPSGLINGKVEQIKLKSLNKQNTFSGNIKWIDIENRYFITSIINSDETNQASMRVFVQDDIVENQYIFPNVTINIGEVKEFKNKLYFGPKSISVLEAAGYGLKKAIDFGMFDFIARPCVKFMNLLYTVMPNYGICIIILTVIIKIIFWPLGSKSYKSMNSMKRLQPIMTDIRNKYKDDKQKINQEVMKLYKTYKVNPLSGCLPVVVQIPIFFALYRMLYEAIELRHAPFFGWIKDLSAPDRLLNFNFAIPFMEPPYGIPVLTIIMGLTMFVQQKMSPPPGDPTQAKMMLFMPILFTFIFINFSSGLVLYWLVNNIFSITQQYYINKKLG